MGRRSDSVAYYPGQWEFAPGGSVPADQEPAEVLRQELHEECGWIPTGPARSVAVLYDPDAFSWEIVSILDVEPGSQPGTETWEYDELAVIEPGLEPEPLAPVARQMIRIRDGLDR
jgi:8-oxo-dGTP pyrophosphatase MutT (NUDIX family)